MLRASKNTRQDDQGGENLEFSRVPLHVAEKVKVMCFIDATKSEISLAMTRELPFPS